MMREDGERRCAMPSSRHDVAAAAHAHNPASEFTGDGKNGSRDSTPPEVLANKGAEAGLAVGKEWLLGLGPLFF